MAVSKEQRQFVDQAMAAHGRFYEYGNAQYVDIRTDITVTCQNHGDFTVCPGEHLNGKGCPMCAAGMEATQVTQATEQEITPTEERCYRGYIIRRCPIHGHYLKSPRGSQLDGDCPMCYGLSVLDSNLSTNGFNPSNPALLYLIEVVKKSNGVHSYKVGITGKDSAGDCYSSRRDYTLKRTLWQSKRLDGQSVLDAENAIKKAMRSSGMIAKGTHEMVETPEQLAELKKIISTTEIGSDIPLDVEDVNVFEHLETSGFNWDVINSTP